MGVRADLPGIDTNLRDFDVTLGVQSLNPGNLDGGTGGITLQPGYIEQPQLFRNTRFTLADDELGSFIGRVSEIQFGSNPVQLLAESMLNRLNVEVTIRPQTTDLDVGMDLILANANMLSDGLASTVTTFPGWRGLLWDYLKHFCAVQNLEMVPHSTNPDVVVFRAIRSQAFEPQLSSLSYTVNDQQLAQNVAVNNYDYAYVGPVPNELLNPSFETSAASVAVWENLTPNPRCGVNATNWSVHTMASGASSGARVTGLTGYPGGTSTGYRMTVTTGSGGSPVVAGILIQTGFSPFTPGAQYSMSAYIKTSFTADMMLSVRWLDAGMSLLSTSFGPSIPVTAGVITQVYRVGAAPIANPATYAEIRIIPAASRAWVIGETVEASCCLVAQAQTLSYFDGAYSPDSELTASWFSTTDASKSLLSALGLSDVSPVTLGPAKNAYSTVRSTDGIASMLVVAQGTDAITVPVTDLQASIGFLYTLQYKIWSPIAITITPILRGALGTPTPLAASAWTNVSQRILAGAGAVGTTGFYIEAGAGQQGGHKFYVDEAVLAQGLYGDFMEFTPATTEDMQILSVNAGETTSYDIQLNAWVSSVNQPVAKDLIGPEERTDEGAYCVAGADGLPVTAAQWLGQGGKVVVSLTDDPSVIKVEVTAPSLDILPGPDGGNRLAPYSIAATSGDNTMYNGLHITGTGLRFNRTELVLPTGVNSDITIEEIGVTVDNPWISDSEKAYDIGVRAAQAWAGPTYTFTEGTTSKRHALRNVVGGRFGGDLVKFRVENATGSSSGIRCQGISDTTFQDFDDSVDTMTFNAWATVMSGLSFEQWATVPLKVS